MDKLQPLIRQRFWILCGLLVLLSLYGYYSANSQLKAATTAREASLQSTFQAIPKGNEPNANFVQKLQEVNGFLEVSVDDAIVELWKNQQKRMTWPAVIANRIPKTFMDRFETQVPPIYKSAFDDNFKRLQERIQPVKPLVNPLTGLPGTPGSMGMTPGIPQQNQMNVDLRRQKVWLTANLPQPTFDQFSITSQDVWDAQIDIWMTELLIDSIVRINVSAESINESVIRRLDRLELMGGSGEPQTSDAGAAGGEMGMDDMGMGGAGPVAGQKISFFGSGAGMGSMGGSESMGMGGSSNSPTSPLAVNFNPAQEFGPPVPAAGDSMEDSSGMDDMGMADGMGMGLPTGPLARYIGDSETSPYYQRGFYMSVIIKQNKIADYIAEIVNSDWPIQVKRFQVGANPYRKATPTMNMGSGYESGSGMSDFEFGSEFGGEFASNPDAGMSSGGASFSGLDDTSGMGGFGVATKTIRPNPYRAGIPKRAEDALNDPDLVQLDLCGIITMYKQPTEIFEAIEARKAAAAGLTPEATPAVVDPDAPGEVEAAPVDPTDPEAPAADPAMEAKDGAVPDPGIPVEGAPAVAPAVAPEGAMEAETPNATPEAAPANAEGDGADFVFPDAAENPAQ